MSEKLGHNLEERWIEREKNRESNLSGLGAPHYYTSAKQYPNMCQIWMC